MLGNCFSLMLDVSIIADDKKAHSRDSTKVDQFRRIVMGKTKKKKTKKKKKKLSQVAAIKTYNHRGMIHAKEIQVAP